MDIASKPSPRGMNLVARLQRRAQRDLATLHDLALDGMLGISTHAPMQRPDPNATSSPYQPMGYRALEVIGRHLDLGPTDVLYDLGCGKGRVNCYFARQPIARSVGIELAPELAEAARRNAAAMRGRRASIDIHASNALHHDYGDATAFFLYNPFGADVMRAVLEQIDKTRAGKPIRIVYAYPVHGAEMDAAPWLRRAGEPFVAPHLDFLESVQMWESV